MMTIPDIPVNRKKAGYNYAKETTPRILGVAQSKIANAGKGVWTRDMIKNQIQFGPYQGRTGKGNPKDPNYAWQLKEMAGGLNYIDASDERYSNWMRYVNCARNINEMNLMAYQFEGGIYYRTFRLVAPHEELFVFYGEQFGCSLGIDVKNFRNPTLTNEKDVSFYCAECNSVFTSPLYLEQHEMTCLLGRPPSKKPKLLHATQTTVTTVAPQSKNHGCTTASNQTSNPMMSVSNVQEPLSFTDGTSNEQHLSLNEGSTYGAKDKKLIELSGEKGVNSHLCNKTYSKKCREHENVRPFKCSDCDKAFPSNARLDRHFKSVHLKVCLFKCNMCHYKCSQNGDLKKHMDAVHLNIRRFECNMCDYKCSCNGHLKQHMDGVHLNVRKFECNMCDYKCSRNGDLKKHMNAVHLNIHKFECNMCDYKCSENSNLKKHMDAVHLNVRKFECNMCDYKCSQNTDLKRHMDSVHLNVHKFECNMCDYKCSRNDRLKKHMDAVHLNVCKF
ncbi:zinc finger protein 184 [Nilaparvata lugens]|uniref:zinc finger protein 184 n=1 Tax=Nilaparvata lugens TaxID=108931 RepID=UPI00193D3220|nr:zinc finger protein 184 [Nilaparvata lugens]